MPLIEVLITVGGLYLLAAIVAVIVQRSVVLPAQVDPRTLVQNAEGRMTAAQRRALLIYAAPELVFSLAAIALAIGWDVGDGLSGLTLRWGLAGMAFVRLGVSLPLWRDLIGGRVMRLEGPLRRIAFRQRYALATEDGPIMVLPAERSLALAYEPNSPVTIFYAAHSKRVVAVRALPGAVAAPSGDPAPPIAI